MYISIGGFLDRTIDDVIRSAFLSREKEGKSHLAAGRELEGDLRHVPARGKEHPTAER